MDYIVVVPFLFLAFTILITIFSLKLHSIHIAVTSSLFIAATIYVVTLFYFSFDNILYGKEVIPFSLCYLFINFLLLNEQNRGVRDDTIFPYWPILVVNNLLIILSNNIFNFLILTTINFSVLFIRSLKISKLNPQTPTGKWRYVISLLFLMLGFIILINQGFYQFNTADFSKIGWTKQTMAAPILIAIGLIYVRGFFPRRLFFKNEDFPILIAVLLPQFTNFALYKVVGIFNSALPELHNILSYFFIFSAIYNSFLLTGETNLKLFSYHLFLSQTSLVGMGVIQGDVSGIFGSLYHASGVTLTIGGFCVLINTLERHLNIHDIRSPLGLKLYNPKLSQYFLLLGFLSCGLPGGMVFVGEDLLFHSTIHHFPILGFLIILATALNGINVYRMYTLVFCGKSKDDSNQFDLQPHEHRFFLTLVIGIFLFGIFPNLILNNFDQVKPSLFQEATEGH